MESHEHLELPVYRRDLPRLVGQPGGGYKFPEGREKPTFYRKILEAADHIERSYQQVKTKFNGRLDPHLIYKIKVNQSVDHKGFSKSLHGLGDLTVLSVAEDKKGYWVVFSDNDSLQTFKNKLSQYSGVMQGNKYDFFNAIDEIADVSLEDKIGQSLARHPLPDEGMHYLNVELWRMPDDELNSFMGNLGSAYTASQLRITDKLVTRSFALLRAQTTRDVFEELLYLKEIARIDYPFIPRAAAHENNHIDIGEFKVASPATGATGILVVDSGITSNHPLLAEAVGNEESFQDRESGTQDTVGHGTAVAGNAIYGNVQESIDNRAFEASNWLFSAKVMYGVRDLSARASAQYDEEKLLESQLHNAITTSLNNPTYNIKVVNLSFGNPDEVFYSHFSRQFPLAALIDELALQYSDVVFIVSAGNAHPFDVFENLSDIVDRYPQYLVDDDRFRIINPATSALALTVGSIAPPARLFNPYDADLWTPIAGDNAPSPFTRTGFGLNGMVKPELTHYGGNIIASNHHGRLTENAGGKMTLLSNLPVQQLFAYDYGTSFSAPVVAHVAGLIANKFPNASANFIKNLLIQSSVVPTSPPVSGTDSEIQKASLRMQGYGVPDADRALYSFDNRIVLWHEGDIGLKQVQVFSIGMPNSFFEESGEKRLSIVLTFNPWTRATRGDSYLGNRLEFKLFHSLEPDYIAQKFAELDLDMSLEVITPRELDQKEIGLLPGTNTRKAGCHQKGVRIFSDRIRNVPGSPLTLVLMNVNKWMLDDRYRQSYCISLAIEHSKEINLYDAIRSEMTQRVRLR